jgi:glutamine phosphoribosylpyrophosphate amidotransferase
MGGIVGIVSQTGYMMASERAALDVLSFTLIRILQCAGPP